MTSYQFGFCDTPTPAPDDPAGPEQPQPGVFARRRSVSGQRRHDKCVELFGCPVCSAVGSEITEGRARLTVVAYRSGCAFLVERTQDRWPLRPAGLPAVPGQTPFGRYAGHGPTLRAWEKRRASRSSRPIAA